MQGKQRVYISGPMTGYKDWNYPAFHAAKKKLESNGYAVVCPAELGGSDLNKPWQDFIRTDLMMILTIVDMVAVLPGWEDSKGARVEIFTAKVLGLPVVRMQDLTPIDPQMQMKVYSGGVMSQMNV